MQKRPSLTSLALALFMLALPVAIFWRRDLFFIMDEWTSLMYFTEFSFHDYLFREEAELWRPVSRLAYYVQVKLFGLDHGPYVLVNALGTGVNAILFWLFCRRLFQPRLAAALALVYAGLGIHQDTVWVSVNQCYIIALSFYLGTLLSIDAYLRTPSGGKLMAIGVLALLAVLSHAFPILLLPTIPLYVLLRGEPADWPSAWPLCLISTLVFLAFSAGYFTFLGLKNVTHHNPQMFSQLPGVAFWKYWFYVAIIAPCSYLFTPSWVSSWKGPVLAILLMLGFSGLIALGGTSQERRLGLWALSINALPTLLVALARHMLPLVQAYSPRYAIFTAVGVLLISGTAWNVLVRTLSPPRWLQATFLGGVLALVIFGHSAFLLRVLPNHQRISRIALSCYQDLQAADPANEATPEWRAQLFCPEAHPFLTRGQALAIHRYLHGMPREF